MLKKNFRTCLVFLLFFISFLRTETIKLATYNILNFPEAIALQRIDDFRIVMNFINPDVLVVQEMQSQFGVDLFLDSVMQHFDDAFRVVSFHDGPDTDNALFYRSDKVEFLSAQYLPTQNRDIAEYKLRFKKSQKEFYIFSLHFKASQGPENEAIRLLEASILRNHLDSLPPKTNFLVLGDFNIYYSDEPAFGKLTDSLINNNGRLFDPLRVLGNWHANIDFAHYHTQSTRFEQLPDGGASGGLDDRFDMILCSTSLLDSNDLFILKDSYTICGNDGNHFDVSINYGYNQAVPPEVADALYYASDHLPVLVDITDNITHITAEPLVKIWPNPMHETAEIKFPRHDDFQNAKITLTNILGQTVYRADSYDPVGFELQRGRLPIGIYVLHLQINTRYNEHNYQTKLAILK